MASTEWLSRPSVFCTVLAVFVACSSPEEKAQETNRTIRSWEATLRRTSDALAQDAIPRVYADQVLRAAIAATRQQARRPEWNAVPMDTRRSLENQIARLGRMIGEPHESLPGTP
jgi:hypothetical protein